MPSDADFVVVLPRDASIGDERFIAVGGGECLFWKDGDVSVVNAGFVEVSAPYEQWRKIRAGVLTISDKGACGERLDTAGPALADMIEALGSTVVRREIVPDDREKIAATLKAWADEDRLQVVLTTGGTGLSKRDVTPEAFMDVHDKLVPGFGETMRARSMLYTERGFLTRSLAVVRGETLMIAFPGSERAVRQCFEAIAGALRHGIEILSGWDAECGGHRH
ncbi:MogA/MoaB family molybdenum cofactor biosynthesis protein [Synergistaceae bacterium OttesenSCG-928-I11]|nr:MogA/MoaB family molybdenum cofactor biosynthesis protein [Synergistaceae bacterium OttesenSCG-928-I11]